MIAELAIIASNGLSKVTNQIALTVALTLPSWVNQWSVKRENIGVDCEFLQCHEFFVFPAYLVHWVSRYVSYDLPNQIQEKLMSVRLRKQVSVQLFSSTCRQVYIVHKLALEPAGRSKIQLHIMFSR